jgi:hypothetical protein
MRLSLKESRMNLANPTKLDRKSGGSRGICGSLNKQPMLRGITAPLVIPGQSSNLQ